MYVCIYIYNMYIIPYKYKSFIFIHHIMYIYIYVISYSLSTIALKKGHFVLTLAAQKAITASFVAMMVSFSTTTWIRPRDHVTVLETSWDFHSW